MWPAVQFPHAACGSREKNISMAPLLRMAQEPEADPGMSQS